MSSVPLKCAVPVGAQWVIAVVVAHWALVNGLARGSDSPADQEPISYSSAEVDDPVARLQQRLDRGDAHLKFEADHGYLRSVLEFLGAPISSQGLVYSKTSFQRDRISPETPRAVYFGDDVYVGWVQHGEVIELSAVDPQKGAIFYTLPQQEVDRPKFRRHTHECLQCHDSSLTRGIPGHLVRSVYPDTRGQPILSAGTFITGHQSPLRERWGGWFVTGTHGAQAHMGNLIVRDRELHHRPEKIDLTAGANCTNLSSRCEVSPYLSTHSDIVALMVLEHQTQMHNLLTRANYQTRLALRDERVLQQVLKHEPGERLGSTLSRIKSVGEPLVRYLLFADEALLSEPVAGTSSFARDFAERGPRDPQGRSLREFDLQRRMFRYPMSYLIYSDAFDQQPEPLKEYVYQRLWQVLHDGESRDQFPNLSDDDRRQLVEILRATKRDLPEYWREG